MKITVMSGQLKGSVTPPSSKSHGQRLLLAAAMSLQETAIFCDTESDDIRAMARCLCALGARIRKTENGFRVIGPLKGGGEDKVFSCGESAAVLRFLLPVCASLDFPVSLRGEASLQRRPMTPFLTELRRHGAVIEGDALPFRTAGGLKSGDYLLPGTISSQYFSGLLFAMPLLQGDSTLRYVPPLQSKPYTELTCQTLSRFGIRIERISDGWRIPGGQTPISPGALTAERDWSAAALYYAARYLGSDVIPEGMNNDSLQADRAIIPCLQKLGSEIYLGDCPDLGPILAVCAALGAGETVFREISRLRLKESDRVDAIEKMIAALGGKICVKGDTMTVYAGSLRGGTVDPMGDHRIAMSAAVAALRCQEPVTILHAECVRKSYPGFFEDLEMLGGKILRE